jgi:hypothetical protein
MEYVLIYSTMIIMKIQNWTSGIVFYLNLLEGISNPEIRFNSYSRILSLVQYENYLVNYVRLISGKLKSNDKLIRAN